MKTITITSLTGVGPYFVYLCDQNMNNCIYISIINDNDIEYTFTVPVSYASIPTLGVKLIDSTGCEITSTISI